MNKLLKSLLVTVLCVTGANAASTNKTFLLPRSHGVNMAMEYTTWNELINMDKEDRFGANFQVIGFYQDSTSDSARGKYFGVLNKNNFAFGGATTSDMVSTWVMHHVAETSFTRVATDAATLNLSASQEAAGAKIFYYQDLEKLLKGLYLKANLPIVYVKNSLNLGVSNLTGLTSANVYDYFKGSFTGLTGAYNAQKALDHAKIDGSRNTTSVADIDIALGYKFLDKEKYHMSINVGFTIPTGTKADGVYLWEPIVGNGRHWALGAGLDFGANLWTKNDQNIKLTLALNYRYLFSSNETRTIGLKDLSWGQYYLIAQTGSTGAVYPAANLLTKKVGVTPGSQLDGIASLAYNNGGFSIELGYNLFWKDSESVKFKDSWTDGQYAIVSDSVDSAVELTAAGSYWANSSAEVASKVAYASSYKVDQSNFDLNRAASESQVTNKIYGGLGYIFKQWEYPLMLGIGAHYEFASRDAVQNWGLWGKIGIGF